MNPDNLTHDHSKKPKPVNFGTVVASAFVFLLVALLAAYIFLRADARKVVPQRANPRPNSSLALPAGDTRDA